MWIGALIKTIGVKIIRKPQERLPEKKEDEEIIRMENEDKGIFEGEIDVGSEQDGEEELSEPTSQTLF